MVMGMIVNDGSDSDGDDTYAWLVYVTTNEGRKISP